MKLVIAEKSMLGHDIARAICGKKFPKPHHCHLATRILAMPNNERTVVVASQQKRIEMWEER